jgi:hypothetical protein
MRNILSNGVLIFAGLASIPAIITTADTKLPPMPSLPTAAEVKADPRLQLLERFFEAADAPARAYANIFLMEADLYALDWRLLPSISFVETTGGKAAKNNNLFGWDCGRAEFASVIEGIRTVAYHLARSEYYKNKGLDELLWAYNPTPEYSEKVKYVMTRIAPSATPAE